MNLEIYGMDKCLVLLLACATLLVGWYQYQMIEKLRTLQTENTELAARVGTLEDSLKNQQKMTEKLRTENTELAARFGTLEDSLKNQQKMTEKLRTENTELAVRVGTLEERQKNQQAVAAHVRLSGTLLLTGKARVMYDVEVTNIGKAFNFQKGEFATSVAGVYIIHVTACMGGALWMNLNIIENDKVIGRVFSGDDAYHNCGSEAMSIHLDVGDTVWVQRDGGISTVLDQVQGWNSFTVALIQAD